MFRINPEHLATIGYVAENIFDVGDEFPNLLRLPVGPEMTMRQISPTIEAILSGYFKHRTDVPDKRYPDLLKDFTDTAKYALIMFIFMRNEIEHELKKSRRVRDLFVNHLQAMAEFSPSIFNRNDLDSQVFMLNKIITLGKKNQIIDDDELSEIVKRMVIRSIRACNERIPFPRVNKEPSDTLLNYARLVKDYLKNAERNIFSVWIDDFKKKSMEYHGGQVGYEKKNSVMKSIIRAWELIKFELSSEDVAWLIQQAESIQRKSRPSISPFSRQCNNLGSFALFMLNPVILGSNLFLFLLMAIQYYLLTSTFTNRSLAVDSVISYQEYAGQNAFQSTGHEEKLLDNIILKLIKAYNLEGKDLASEHQKISFQSGLLPLAAVVFVILGLAANYVAYKRGFFERQKNIEPITIPAWCFEMQETFHLIHEAGVRPEGGRPGR